MQVHSLKGAAATVSAHALQVNCAQAQRALLAGELSGASALLPSIKEQLDLLNATFSR
jgi:HPt (histidine-containing phosphotransfer) domain-containing protein